MKSHCVWGLAGALQLAAVSTLEAQADLTQAHYRWRNDDGPEGSGTPPSQVTSTSPDTTASSSDVLVSQMSLTVEAGDYIVWFSSSVENDNGTDDTFVSIYLDGVKHAHTERQATTDSSIPDTPFPVATHLFLPGVAAGQTIDVRWRTTGGTSTMHERTLVAAPIVAADVTQVSATADSVTSSLTDVAVAGMSITPGAGDYLVWFSGSVEGDTNDTNQFVSIYRNGAKVAHTERQNLSEGSITGASFPVATHAFLATVGAGEPIDVRWRTEGGTATMHERTLVVARVTAADISQASATADTGTSSGTDVVLPPLTLTPGTAADYLAWFSGSMEGDTDPSSQFASLYDAGAQLPHSQRRVFTEGSIPGTSFPIAGHAFIPGVGAADAIDVRFRTTGGNATVHERTLVLQKLSSVAGATWAEAEDTKLFGITIGTPKRVRFAISNEGVSGSGPVSYELQVAETATCSAGVYTTVPTASTGHWQVLDSSFITDGEATNNITGLTDEATTFVSGELKDAGNTTGSITLASDEFTEIEFMVQATPNATENADYCFRLYDATNGQVLDTYGVYAEVRLAIAGGTLTLANHDLGQVPDRFTSAPSVTDVLFRFKLTETPPVTITELRVSFTTGSGVVDADVTAGSLYRDDNNDGVVDGGDALLASGVAGSGGHLVFTGLSENPGAGSNYLVVATVANLVPGDTTTFSLGSADIDELEVGVAYAGSITSAVHAANAARTVYYSVGTAVADLKSGTPTVTISSGTATFSVSQPANIGVGDEVTYNGGTRAYISGRLGATVYTVTTATGLVPPDVAGATVDSITRAFDSLSAATTGSADASHLNTSDLVTSDIQLNWACYNDGPDPSSYVRIEEPWVTGPSNYIRVFTPVTPAEVGVSQRHRGVAGTGYRIAPTGPAGTDFFNFILVSTDQGYVRVEGVEIDGSGLTDGENVRGLMSNDTDGLMQDVRFSHNLIHDITNSTIDDNDTSRVIGIFLDDTDNSKVSNNIIYNLTSVSTSSDAAARGIELDDPGKTHHVYNNTVYNVRVTASTSSARGILDTGGSTGFVRNNYVGLTDSVLGNEFCFTGPFAAENNNVSSDGTAVGAGSRTGENAYATYFVDVTPGSENFHLLADSSSLWSTTGADLDGDPALPVLDDIDGEPRHPSTPDVGADEGAPVTHYRSIGTAPNYSTGTIDATAGSPIVTGTGTAWVTANRGRGDRIAFNLEEYTIQSVDSETRLTLTEPVASTFAGGYTIMRQFTTLQGWVDCIDGSGGCTYFPVGSSSLVNDDRSEVGIAYNDSVVPTDPDFTAEVDIVGMTTDATHTIRLTVDGDNRHYGIPGAGVLIDCSSCSTDAVRVDADYVTVEWLEIVGVTSGSTDAGIKVQTAYDVLLQFILTHGNYNGIRLSANGGKSVTIRNTVAYNNIDIGLEGDEVEDVLVIENCTVFGNGQHGIAGMNSAPTTTVRNSISMNNGGNDFDGISVLETSISHDGTASCGTCLANRDFTDSATPGAPFQGNGWVMFQNLTPGSEDFHLRDDVVLNDAQDAAQDLTPNLYGDIDAAERVAPWDVGADDVSATTAVELVSFEATGLNRAVELRWETGSELNNLGFYLYRATAPDGPYERTTESIIPGLGSSPEGARYRYIDEELENGVTYFYELEDIETTGETERHGPVSAHPSDDAASPDPDEDQARLTYGDPTTNELRIVRRGPHHVVLELVTNGFYAEVQTEGTVLLDVPGLDLLQEGDGPSIPISRPWIDAVAGREVDVLSVHSESVESIDGLWLAGVAPPELASDRGTVRASRRTRRASRREGFYPSTSARLVQTGFQGRMKRAQLELAPIRWDGSTGTLTLTRRLVVHISFARIDPEETSLGRSRGRRRRSGGSSGERDVIARLAARERGLYEVRYEDLPLPRGPSTGVRLTRLGEAVPYHLEPATRRFGPGSRLYFFSPGGEANAYDREAVYELELGAQGRRMAVASASPGGATVSGYWSRSRHEENRLYQPGLLDAPDLWLWDMLLAPITKDYSFEAHGLVPRAGAELSVWLQGTSNLDADPDHHVRLLVNGTFVAEASWDGKRPIRIEATLLPGVVTEGGNRLSIENVGDTEAAYSLVMLDRFEVTYASVAEPEAGYLEGTWLASGTAVVSGIDSRGLLLDVTGAEPIWLEDFEPATNGVRFRSEGGRTYLVVADGAVHRPEIRRATEPVLAGGEGADYLAIGPRAFLDAARPLLDHRRSQGLIVRAAAVEDIYEELGYGESRPEAIRDFIEQVYHSSPDRSLRYVLLLGDASYDFKNYLGMGFQNHVPPLMVRTSHLWTVSDPALAAINGEDPLPDLAIGRLPAGNRTELDTMIEKILAYESGEASLGHALVLVADEPDRAGDFDADVASIAEGVLAGREVEEIHLSELGAATTRGEILEAFDGGASLVSYVGHGGIHLWSGRNILDIEDVQSLRPQAQQPLFLAMNCLNGYFHFPYFHSLAEALVEAEAKGAIAAIAPSGFSRNDASHRFHELLLDQVFNRSHERLGDALLSAQSGYAKSGLFDEVLVIYHLLGDPALKLRHGASGELDADGDAPDRPREGDLRRRDGRDRDPAM